MRYFFLLLISWFFTGVVGHGEVLEAGESIQAAIDASPEGATLEVGPGTWVENLRITKSITLKGAGMGKTVIRGAVSKVPVILIAGDESVSVTLTGMTITGVPDGKCADPVREICPSGIVIQGKAHVEVTLCEVVGAPGYGLFVGGYAHVLIAESVFSGNGRAGIWAHAAAELTITGAEIARNHYGLIASAWSRVTIRNSRIVENGRDGVLAADGSHLYLWENEISGNGRTGVCVNIPGCYRTKRTFTGIIRGGDNAIPSGKEEGANEAAAYCPKALHFLRSKLGGVYPTPSPRILFSKLPSLPPMLGSPGAPLTMIEFSDFSCPYCARFAMEVMPLLRQEYIDTGKLRLFFLPLPVHGEAARKEAEATLCAQAQGLFWPDFDNRFLKNSVRNGI
jgi:hypothetical protein